MEKKAEDNSVLAHIKQLTEKEEHLYGKTDLNDEDIKDMHKIKSELDQYWDLLRQRRALRDAGENPNQAEMRSSDTIENYTE
jgi:flagellar biosynthesis/type III secretory pathway chaperone